MDDHIIPCHKKGQNPLSIFAIPNNNLVNLWNIFLIISAFFVWKNVLDPPNQFYYLFERHFLGLVHSFDEKVSQCISEYLFCL